MSGLVPGCEGDGDVDAAVRLAGRGEIEQVVEARELLLDDLGDRVLAPSGRGARIGGADRPPAAGRCRVLRDRQGPDRQRAGQHDHDGDDPGEDRPVDEEAGQHSRAYGPGARRRAGGDGAHDLRRPAPSAGPRRSPGRRRFRPEVTSHLSPTAWPSCSRRQLRLAARRRPPARWAGRVSSRVTPCCGTRRPLGATPSATWARTYMPGSSIAVRVGEQGAQGHRAGGLVDRDVGELQLALHADSPTPSSSFRRTGTLARAAGELARWPGRGAGRSRSVVDWVTST